jgi:hypothetical protein
MPNIHLDVSEFISACSERDIKEIVSELVSRDLIKSLQVASSISINELEFRHDLIKMSEKYISMESVDIYTVQQIAKKYV